MLQAILCNNSEWRDVSISFDEYLAAATAEHETEQETVRLDSSLLVKKKAQYNIRDNATSRLFLLESKFTGMSRSISDTATVLTQS